MFYYSDIKFYSFVKFFQIYLILYLAKLDLEGRRLLQQWADLVYSDINGEEGSLGGTKIEYN